MTSRDRERTRHYRLEWPMPTPPHWGVNRLKWSMTGLINGTWGDEPNGVDDLICVRVADFDRTRFTVVDAPPTLRAIGKKEQFNRLLRQGDLLIEKSGGGHNQPVGCVVEFDHTFNAVCSNFIGRIAVAPDMWSRYWTYVHASLYSSRLNVPAIKQTTGIQNLDTGAYFNQRVPFPPLSQQRAIADYLDRETARLDALVAAKERVIGLLAEKRRALITRAVTRGLDPHVPFRDSGIPWLGKIPAHWETRRLKFLSPQITVGIVVTPAKYYEVTGVPCLRSLNVRERGLSDADLVFISEESNLLHSKSIIHVGDLVAVRSGQPGTTAVVDQRFDGANCIDLIIIRRSHCINSEFLAHFLNSDPAKMQFLSGSGGAIQQHFNIESATRLVLPLPSLEEQRDIAASISEATAKVDALSTATERTIALLRERRSALIAAAVTGHIDSET